MILGSEVTYQEVFVTDVSWRVEKVTPADVERAIRNATVNGPSRRRIRKMREEERIASFIEGCGEDQKYGQLSKSLPPPLQHVNTFFENEIDKEQILKILKLNA